MSESFDTNPGDKQSSSFSCHQFLNLYHHAISMGTPLVKTVLAGAIFYKLFVLAPFATLTGGVMLTGFFAGTAIMDNIIGQCDDGLTLLKASS